MSLPGPLVVGQVSVATGQAYVGNVDMVAGSLVVDGTLRGGVTMTAGRVAVGSGGRITGPEQLGTGLVQVAPGGWLEGTVQVGTYSQPDLLCPAAASGGCSLTGGSGPTVVPPLPLVAGGGVVSPGGLRGFVLGGFLRRLFGLGPWAGALALGLHLLTWLGLPALALPVAAIWPEAVDGVRRQIERDPGRSALIGLLALVLALPVLLAISITIVGIPVAFAAALGMVTAWFFGYVAVVSLIGARTGALARGGEAPCPPPGHRARFGHPGRHRLGPPARGPRDVRGGLRGHRCRPALALWHRPAVAAAAPQPDPRAKRCSCPRGRRRRGGAAGSGGGAPPA